MTFAVIDLGTNTFNLLIGTSGPDNTFNKLYNTKIPVKLGEGAINSGYIAEIPYQRGIQALCEYRKTLDEYKVSKTYAFATSAIRSAHNGGQFIHDAKQKAGIDVTVINGNEEAELIYYGNRMAVDLSGPPSVIMDIGGGSNEFIICDDKNIFWKHSFKLGAARLLEKFKPSDPITPAEIENFNNYLRKEMEPLTEAIEKYKPVNLVGSSGAFESLVDMIAGKFGTRPTNETDTEYIVNCQHYKAVTDMIIASTLEERRNIKGLIEMRVDMMVISCLLIDFMFKEYPLKHLRVSTYSLKEGVISRNLGLNGL